MTFILVLVSIGAGAFYYVLSRESREDSSLIGRARATAQHAMGRVLSSVGIASSSSWETSKKSQFARLASSMGRNRKDPKAFDTRLAAFVQELGDEDAKALQKIAVDPNGGHGERFLAAYALSQRPDDFSQQLEEIASSHHSLLSSSTEAHSISEINKRFEESVRIQALLGLDSRSARTDEQRAFFASLLKQGNTNIRSAAYVAMLGAEWGKPQLPQYIESKIRGGLHEIGR